MASPFSRRTPTGVLIAQAVGITASTYLLGQNSTLSFVSIPAIMQAPAPLAAKQWYTILNSAGTIAIPLAITSAMSLAYVAFRQDPRSAAFKLNAAAAVVLPSMIPFTIFFIMPTNNELIDKMNLLASASLEDKAVEANVADEETTHALLDKWATLNLARTVLVGVGAFCAVLAAVDNREVYGLGSVGLASGANRI